MFKITLKMNESGFLITLGNIIFYIVIVLLVVLGVSYGGGNNPVLYDDLSIFKPQKSKMSSALAYIIFVTTCE